MNEGFQEMRPVQLSVVKPPRGLSSSCTASHHIQTEGGYLHSIPNVVVICATDENTVFTEKASRREEDKTL